MRAPIECVWTLDLLRAWGFAAYLHFVGRCGTRLLPVNDIVEALGLARFVRYYDARPGTAVWDDHLSAVDVALQLRTGVDGTPSTALSDCIAAGVPTVAPAASALALQAPDYVRRVPDMLRPRAGRRSHSGAAGRALHHAGAGRLCEAFRNGCLCCPALRCAGPAVTVHLDVSQLVQDPRRSGIQRAERELIRYWPGPAPLRPCRFERDTGELHALPDHVFELLCDDAPAGGLEVERL